MLSSLLVAILSPFVWGFMNIVDKYSVSHKVKKPLGFAIVAAFVNFLFGIIISLFLSWEGLGIKDIIFPSMVGILAGVQFVLYYTIMKKVDASHVAGLIYLYPIIVAFLSFIFLHEKLPWISYAGMIITLTGVIMLSIRLNKFKLKHGIWMISIMIVLVAIYEFFIKISTSTVSVAHGLALNCIFIGLTNMCLLFVKRIRTDAKGEIKNFKWAFFSESLTVLGVWTIYYAMTSLPATFVTAVAATQPLAVLFFERIIQGFGGKISKDNLLLPKLVPISLIVLGVLILYLPQLITELVLFF
jgi:drug/metabolite transporter (DMT)-like permease